MHSLSDCRGIRIIGTEEPDLLKQTLNHWEKVVVSISVLNEPVSPTCSLRKFLMSPFCAKKEHNSITNTNSTTMFMITKLFSEEKKDSKYVSCNNKTLKDVKSNKPYVG